jgi:hypothetical protein
MVRIPRPEAWKDSLDDETIEVLPLVEDPAGRFEPGWCTYVYEHLQAPELEVICGGINSKTPKAGAVWRQGNLLHFGFEQSPVQLNENGRALLVNSISYISRFSEDRPIIRPPCVFVSGKRIVDREALGRLLKRKDGDLAILEYMLAPELYAVVKEKTREEIAEWFASIRDFVCADERGRLSVDEQARSFGSSPASTKFLHQAIALLSQTDDRTPLARELLARYVPDGPDPQGTAEQWREWQNENQLYLFFSDTGGYRWYVDPLAKTRGVATNALRGPARATLPSHSGGP